MWPEMPRALHAGWVAMLALAVSGCATPLDVRPLATGRSGVSAYELNGADVHSLRRAAQRLCPLGGDVVREAGFGLPPEAEAGRWRSTLNTLAAWVEPPRRQAQLVVLCREAGDRASLQAALHGLQQPAPVVEPQPEVTAALPVGPIQPEW